MGWFSNDDRGDRRKDDRAAGMARAQRLAELYESLQQAVAAAVAEDGRVASIVFQLAMLDVRVETTVGVEMVYQPYRGPVAETGAEATEPAASMGNAVPLVDDADRVRLHGMGISTEQ